MGTTRADMTVPWGTDTNMHRHVDWNAQSASKGFGAQSRPYSNAPASAQATPLQQHMNSSRAYAGDSLDQFSGKTARDLQWEKKREQWKARQQQTAYGQQDSIRDHRGASMVHSSFSGGGPSGGQYQAQQVAPAAAAAPAADGQARYGRRGSESREGPR